MTPRPQLPSAALPRGRRQPQALEIAVAGGAGGGRAFRRRGLQTQCDKVLDVVDIEVEACKAATAPEEPAPEPVPSSPTSLELEDLGLAEETEDSLAEEQLASPKEKRKVWFNSPMNTSHPVTPYAEIYGVHPRHFNFDRYGNKISPFFEPLSSSEYEFFDERCRGSYEAESKDDFCVADSFCPVALNDMASVPFPPLPMVEPMQSPAIAAMSMGWIGSGICGPFDEISENPSGGHGHRAAASNVRSYCGTPLPPQSPLPMLPVPLPR